MRPSSAVSSLESCKAGLNKRHVGSEPVAGLDPVDAWRNDSELQEVGLAQPGKLLVVGDSEKPHALLEERLGEFAMQAVLQVAHAPKHPAQRAYRVVFLREDGRAIGKLAVKEFAEGVAKIALARAVEKSGLITAVGVLVAAIGHCLV